MRYAGAVLFVLSVTLPVMAQPGSGPVVSIRSERFFIDGAPTYEGVTFGGRSLEGLLFNSRMVQGIFDDENPETRRLWEYPDTNQWDPERNTKEFVEAMSSWREHGLQAFTVNLQGGGPIYRKPFPYNEYINSAYDPLGRLKADYMDRLGRILDRAAELKMMVILGLAYFGIDHRYIESPAAIRHMTDEVVDWLADRDDRHVLIEIANESTKIRSRGGSVGALELMDRIRARSAEAYADGFTLLCSTSLGGGHLPDDQHIRAMDFILVHGNGQGPHRHREMIDEIRSSDAFDADPKPIVFNEAHTDVTCLVACAENGASWGYFDQGTNNYRDGYQTPPVRWGINTASKRRFFELLQGITDGKDPRFPPSGVHVRGITGLPKDGRVHGIIEVAADLDDRWGIDRVEWYVDDRRVNTERSYPYYLGGDTDGEPYGYDVSALDPGEHVLRAVVHAVGGGTAEITRTITIEHR